MKVLSSPNHPCRTLLDGTHALPHVDPGYMKRIAGFPIYERLVDVARKLKFTIPTKVAVKTTKYPPWQIFRGKTQKLTEQRKGQMDSYEVIEFWNEFKSVHPDHEYVYTDGSRTDMGVGCALVHGDTFYKAKLNKHYSIFTAEAVAILQATNYIRAHMLTKCVICTDSMSVLLAVQSQHCTHPLIIDIRDALHELNGDGGECLLLWIPGHCGIIGNEKADVQAKLAVQMPEEEDEYPVPSQEYLPTLKSACKEYLQDTWDNYNLPTNLKEIKQTVGHWTSSVRAIRREEVVLCRLRLGHTRLTHSYLLDHVDRPECRRCNVYLTVRHILVDCLKYNEKRRPLRVLCQKHGLLVEPSSLLGNSSEDITDAVIKYLCECDLLKKI